MPSTLLFDPQKLLDDMITFVAVLDPSGTVIFVNNTPLIAAGITLDEIKGKKFWDAAWWAYSEDAVNRIREDSAYCASGKSLLHEIQLATADGTLIWIEYSMHPIMSDDGEVEYLVPEGRDITEKKMQQQQMQRLAHYDTLTELPNRVLFADRFRQAIAHSNRTKTFLGVCFLDLDNFKTINDTCGHSTGDALLVEVSHRLLSCIRGDDTASRMGGDEFTLLLGEIRSIRECRELVQRIIDTLSQPYFINGKTHTITASCGVSMYPEDNSDADLLVRHADQAMYQAKITGKNTLIFYDPASEESSLKQKKFLERISQAISSNEMTLFYQPKINLISGHMIAVEALIRWQHPEKGLLSPIHFLPHLEGTQEMIDLGKWVIRQALHQLENWIAEGKNWGISINVDAHHLMQNDFFDDLQTQIDSHPDVPPELLEIEILETVSFSDMKKISDLILRCNEIGVNFSLDDFGTGYSSLVYLKELPVHRLKIDQTFVRDMLVDNQDLALIEGVIGLSKAFKRHIIAEGVETREQGNALLKLGCEHAQGYYIAKPMPADKIIDWEKNYSPDFT